MQRMDMDEDGIRNLMVPQGGVKERCRPSRCLTAGLLLLCASSLAGNVTQFYFGGGVGKRLHNAFTKQEEQLQERYRNLTRNSTGLHDRYQTLVAERASLQLSNHGLTQERDQIQGKANSLTKERDQLQGRFSTLTKERDQLKGQASTLTKERDQLQGRFSTLTKERDLLQGRLSTLTKERDQLQGRFSTISKERDQLKSQASTLTKERDQLQDSSSKLMKEVKTLNDTVESRKCPPGWIKFQCSCYKGHTGEKNWEDSRQYCKSQQADLVIINSREEQIFVNSLLPADTDNWIGLSDIWIEGVWTWVDGTSPNTTYWGRNQPNSHGGNQDCVEFLHRAAKKTWNGGAWNDLDCKELSGCICEK